jgi:UDP-N-acetylmuramyl pentapeptide phosphotransferase/UDP-N-acetylglucosamine-1-phosphate transferase
MFPNRGLTKRHTRGMNPVMAQNHKPLGGGILIMLCLLIGSGLGMALGQPSAGFVLGLVFGGFAAVALAVWDKRRGR